MACKYKNSCYQTQINYYLKLLQRCNFCVRRDAKSSNSLEFVMTNKA